MTMLLMKQPFFFVDILKARLQSKEFSINALISDVSYGAAVRATAD